MIGICLQFHPPKSAAGRRVVVLGERDIEKLKQHVHIQEEMKAFAGDRWQENGLIFPSMKGTLLNPYNVYHTFKEFAKKARLPEIRLCATSYPIRQNFNYLKRLFITSYGVFPSWDMCGLS